MKREIPQNPIDEHDDDKPIGRLLSRREVLVLFGGTGAGAALFATGALGNLSLSQVATATPNATALAEEICVVRPALTEGPYFVDVGLNRSDIRVEPSDGSIKDGTMFKLKFQVQDISSGSCVPLEGAQVDVWHCDAEGQYSGVQDRSFDTSDQMWLRGYQITDEDGMAEFITIFPGWYSGRAVHIHFKIRTDPEADSGYEFTSQFFFDPELIETIYAEEPYADKGLPDVPNDEDNIYQSSDGLLTLNVVEAEGEDAEGYEATFYIALDTSAESTEASEGGGGPGGAGGPPPRGTATPGT